MDNYISSDHENQQLKPAYLVINSTILYHPELDDSDKITFAFLTMFMGEKGYCWWSNKNLCKLLKIEERQLQRRLKKYKKLGLIRIEIDEKNSKRYIYDNTNSIQNLSTGGVIHDGGGVSSVTGGGVIHDAQKYINKNINKNNNNYIVELFTFWQETLGHSKAKLDTARKTKIEKALKLGYSVEDLKLAIQGCKLSKWHMGDNPDRRIYDGIGVIFKNAEKIENFIQLAQQPSQNSQNRTYSPWNANPDRRNPQNNRAYSHLPDYTATRLVEQEKTSQNENLDGSESKRKNGVRRLEDDLDLSF